MADFQPRFVDLVRNFTSTQGTGNFVLGPAVNGFAGFGSALQTGDSFYYSAIGVDKPAEHEVGRGALLANGTISRDPISGTRTNFSAGTKTLALIAAAEWFNQVQAGAGGAGGAMGVAATKTALASASTAQGQILLTQRGCEGLFVFDSANLTTKVSGDPLKGVYVAPSADPTGANGAWVRAERETVSVFWFMTAAEVADVRAFTYTQNVTAALAAASDYIESRGGGTLLLPPGGYLVGEQTFQGTWADGVTPAAYGPHEIISIKNCTKAVKISGYGAVLKAAPGLHYGSFDPITGLRYDPAMPFTDEDYWGSPYRGMIFLDGNASVAIEGVELHGNSTLLVLGGYWGDQTWQVEGSGIWTNNNDSVLIQDCYIHHQPLDGIVLSDPGLTESTPSAPVTVRNCRIRYNGRNNVSLVGGKNVRFENCDLSNAGQALNTVSAELMRSTPGVGIDIEAEGAVIRDVAFSNCTFLGNWRQGFLAATGDSRRVSLDRCKIENLILGRPEYSITDSTIIGYHDLRIEATDEYGPTSTGLTLTIAGAGPYTITRSAGSFITDGHAVGNTVQLSGAGLNANNKDKNLIIRSLTATVLTVVVEGEGGTLTAEGPIAACSVLTGMSAEDGIVVKRSLFTYDAALTESGSLIDGTQGALTNFYWGRLIDCVFDTGTVALPDIAITLSPRSVLIQNCRFKSTSTGLTGLFGRYQGFNYIEYGTSPDIQLGIGSRIESGNVFINGVGQASPVSLPDGDYGDISFSSGGTVAKVESATPTGGSFTVTAAAASDLNLNLTGAAGKQKAVQFQMGGLNRWVVSSDFSAEEGANAGANFRVERYSDGGSFLGNALTISRATGSALFSGNVTAASLSGTLSGSDLSGGSVSLAKIQSISASRLLGNPTGGSATPSEIGLGASLGFNGSSLQVHFAASSKLLGRVTAGAGAAEEIGVTGGLTLTGGNLGIGAITPSSVAASGAITSSGAPIGYATGAGGAVTQATNKSTAVTLNASAGQVTMNSAALAAAAVVSFTVNNSQVAATDTINLNLRSGNATAGTYRYWVEGIAGGSFKIVVENRSGGSLSEGLIFNFAIVKAVNA